MQGTTGPTGAPGLQGENGIVGAKGYQGTHGQFGKDVSKRPGVLEERHQKREKVFHHDIQTTRTELFQQSVML